MNKPSLADKMIDKLFPTDKKLQSAIDSLKAHNEATLINLAITRAVRLEIEAFTR